jgi:hypothetical protein
MAPKREARIKAQLKDKELQGKLATIKEEREKHKGEEKEEFGALEFAELNKDQRDWLAGGDMALTEEQAAAMYGGDEDDDDDNDGEQSPGVGTSNATTTQALDLPKRPKRGAPLNLATYTTSLWTNGIVYYYFDATISECISITYCKLIS